MSEPNEVRRSVTIAARILGEIVATRRPGLDATAGEKIRHLDEVYALKHLQAAIEAMEGD